MYLPRFYRSRITSLEPFLTSEFVHPYHLGESISSFEGYWWVFQVCFAWKFLAANNVDPDETPRFPVA